MLDNLVPQPPDALRALIKLHGDDPRGDKIDLGVGVYRTGQGDTPVFAAIKEAEARLLATQDSKSYLGPEGDLGFVTALMPYVFGREDPTMSGRIAGMQAPGGTGGVRLAVDLAKAAGVRRVIFGLPSWPNHAQILTNVGIDAVTFAHVTAEGTANLDALRAALFDAGPGDAVILHGCCHNPTGVDYTAEQWREIANLVAGREVLPILDLAYQGLGQGMEEDAAGVRTVIAAVPEALVGYSCDKNFGMYRDRVGAFFVMARDPGQLPAILSNGNAFARAAWSMPPDHGAAAARIVLEDPGLTARWLDELETMRARIRQMREQLAAAGQIGALDLAPVATQNGLFSVLKLAPAQIAALRERHGVYMAASGRINLAGLTQGNIARFIAALREVAA
jgi:aromatic-amino-acid transaminase